MYKRRFYAALLMLSMLFLIGTGGYMLLEGWTPLQAFYMTVISLTTVGFSEVAPLTNNGMVFTIMLLLSGIGILTYSATFIAEYLLSAPVGEQLRRRRMLKSIEQQHDHVIICGYGRVGRSAAKSLRNSNRAIVVIENNADKMAELTERGIMGLHGDATDDDVLRQAGIERAWGMIVSIGSDSVSLFIVLSARALNKELYIVTRSTPENEQKMHLAGANRIVSPYDIGGRHMANIIAQPHVTDFFAGLILDDGVELWVEELSIAPDSNLVGQTVGEADIRRRLGVTIISLAKGREGKSTSPTASTLMQAGDSLIVLGTRKQLAALEALAKSTLADQ